MITVRFCYGPGSLAILLLAFLARTGLLEGGAIAWGQGLLSSAGSGFNIRSAPDKVDWRFFWSSGDSWRENFWNYYKSRGYSLDDWSWKWQLGWVSSCELRTGKWCQEILASGLLAKAILVRSRAVQVFGRTWSKSRNRNAINMLARSYGAPGNDRRGKPLFIRQRILFALKGIGGDYASKVGRELAGKHSFTKKYWQILSRKEQRLR